VILLDTNVLSELMRPTPAEEVLDWLDRQPLTSLYTTSISQAEIHYGVQLLADGKRRRAIDAAARAMFEEDFKGRVLPFDSEAALPYALIAAQRRAAGRPISQFGAQIAAIARHCAASIATRNIADFDGCGVKLVNPWARSARR
jgi:toxin FitB